MHVGTEKCTSNCGVMVSQKYLVWVTSAQAGRQHASPMTYAVFCLHQVVIICVHTKM